MIFTNVILTKEIYAVWILVCSVISRVLSVRNKKDCRKFNYDNPFSTAIPIPSTVAPADFVI